MAGTHTVKSLGDGQLPNAKGTLYTVAASTTAIICTITLVNTDTAMRTVNLYVKPSGSSSRMIIPQNMEMGIDHCHIYKDELTLEAGDLIEGDASVATKIDYTINGVEET